MSHTTPRGRLEGPDGADHPAEEEAPRRLHPGGRLAATAAEVAAQLAESAAGIVTDLLGKKKGG